MTTYEEITKVVANVAQIKESEITRKTNIADLKLVEDSKIIDIAFGLETEVLRTDIDAVIQMLYNNNVGDIEKHYERAKKIS